MSKDNDMYYDMFNELMENPFVSLTILRREHSAHVAESAAIYLTLYMECIYEIHALL